MPYILDQTPAVLSVGLRCMQFGYSFHWFGYKQPFLVTPEKKVFLLEVLGDVPYISHLQEPVSLEELHEYPGWEHPKYAFPMGTRAPDVPDDNAFKDIARWIADTGSGMDLIGQNYVGNEQRIRKAAIPMEFNTANGDAYAERVCDEWLTAMGEGIRPICAGRITSGSVRWQKMQSGLVIPLAGLLHAILGHSTGQDHSPRSHRRCALLHGKDDRMPAH